MKVMAKLVSKDWRVNVQGGVTIHKRHAVGPRSHTSTADLSLAFARHYPCIPIFSRK